MLFRIPKLFLNDHAERDLPSPVICRSTKAHYFVALDDLALDELLDDAVYYATEDVAVGPMYLGLRRSAAATVEAINTARTVLAGFEVEKRRALDRIAPCTSV